MTDQISLSEPQLEWILSAMGALKPHGFPWTTVIPVFVSSLLAMCVGIGLEYFKGYRERQRSISNKRSSELAAINVTTVALAYNAELLTHFAWQTILPHYDESHDALAKGEATAHAGPETKQFYQSIQNYPSLMMTAPPLSFLDHDFLSSLPFVVEKEPDLLAQANWLAHLSRSLQQLFHDRNRKIEEASSEKFTVDRLQEIIRSIEIQAQLAKAECATILQAIELIPMMSQTLERIGHSYKDAGQPKKLILPQATTDAIKRLRDICGPPKPRSD